MVVNPVIPKNIRRQAKMLYIWYPKNRTDLNSIHEVLEQRHRNRGISESEGATKKG